MEPCHEALYEEYYKLAYYMAQKWVKRGIDYSEAVSAAHFALAKCVNSNKFDPEKGSFSTYLSNAVDNEVKMFLRGEVKRKDNVSIHETFLNSNDSDYGSSLEDILPDRRYEDMMADKEDMIEAIKIFNKHKVKMKGRELQIISLWLSGYKQKEIAQIVGFTQSYVCRIIKKIISNMRRSLNEL